MPPRAMQPAAQWGRVQQLDEDWTCTLLPHQDPDINPDARPADRTTAPQRNRAAFATGLAQAAFGHHYAPPHQAEWRDLTPDEVRAARESLWVGVAQ